MAPTLRGAVSRNNKAVLRFDDDPDVLEFVGSDRARELSGVGPATPDHLIQTKRRPLWVDAPDPEDVSSVRRAISAGVEEYAQEYSRWYEGHTDGGHPMLDPYPRVALVPGVGMWSTGRDSRAALVTGDIYHHTISVMGSGQSAGDYTSLTSQDAFDAEYWPMELYKLTLAPPGEGAGPPGGPGDRRSPRHRQGHSPAVGCRGRPRGCHRPGRRGSSGRGRGPECGQRHRQGGRLQA